MFIYLFWERDSTSKGGAEKERKRIPSRLCTISAELDVGLKTMNREIMT